MDALGARDLAWLSRETGIPPATIGDYVRRGISRADNALRIAQALNVSTDWLLAGAGAAEQVRDEDLVALPMVSATLSAGPGSLEASGSRQADWVFPRLWLQQSFGHVDGLELMRVRGDSQEPDLSDNDWVMVDRTRRELRDGLHAVVLDDELMIKRVQLEGRYIRLLSRNPDYEPIVIDRSDESRTFDIIGRVVWSSRVHAAA